MTFDPNRFDPSKMDPRLLMELSQLVRELPPEKLNRMQSLMHNMMAGYDVRRELQEFENSLPPAFREKLTALLLKQAGQEAAHAFQPAGQPAGEPATREPSASEMPAREMNVREARLTILRAVADGKMTPEEAEPLL
ncbi:MAG: hypothetical protein NDJ89_12795 [Oligoflexia bacterium]|nr:hypothetical protein [Oligoflexia bacterium]